MESLISLPKSALPPLYRRLVLLDQSEHEALRFDPSAGFEFATRTKAVPVVLEEIAVAAQHYPIVLTAGSQPMPVAVLGFRDGENLYVGADRRWAAGRYVPVYLRCCPFVLVQPAMDRDALVIGADGDAESLAGNSGELLLQHGRPTPVLADRIAMCHALRTCLTETAAFAGALVAARLLKPQEAWLDLMEQAPLRLEGFQVVDGDKLQTLPDGDVLRWHRRTWMAGAHAMLFSAGQWSRLLEGTVSASGRPGKVVSAASPTVLAEHMEAASAGCYSAGSD